MADEAFALSPISARPALPSEQDYDAIREAFMETSRGRWFLGEYAKRNRNADTTMVLDAVARIEQAMAAQKQEPVRNDDELRAVLAAIRQAVEEAAGQASSALTSLELAEKLAPIHKGARIIREISWRWREIGADGRICDLIDSQLGAIEASCTEISKSDGRAALEAAFDLLRHKLDALDDGKEAAAKVNGKAAAHATAPEAVVAPAAAPMTETAVRQAPEAEASAIDQTPVETAFAEPELPAETAAPEPVRIAPEPEPVEAAAIDVAPGPTSAQALAAQEVVQDQLLEGELAPDQLVQDELAQDEPSPGGFAPDLADDLAQDEAVLEMVAIEMAAPDDSVDDFLSEDVVEIHTPLPPVVAPVAARAPAPAPRLEVAPPPPRLEIVPPPPPPQFLPERAPPVAPEPSLGASLLASGILQRPKPPSDPLAPIRRMTQAEKIAFFS